MRPIVSVIVPTRNSAATIGACLDSIRENRRHWFDLEVIVVDNFSSDNTFHLAWDCSDLVDICGPERSAQRNRGARLACGEFLLFIDHDMVLDRNVVEQCMARAQHSIIIPERSFGGNFWARCRTFERGFYPGVAGMEAARFFKRSAFEAVGGYLGLGLEDFDLHWRVERRFGPAGRISAFIMHNDQSPTLRSLWSRKVYHAKAAKPAYDQEKAAYEVPVLLSLPRRLAVFASKPRQLLQHPILTAGMFFMKAWEFAAAKHALKTYDRNKPSGITAASNA